MINPIHLRQLIIDPTLKYLNMYSESASNLMIGTCAIESHLGTYLMQVDHLARPQGPALGIYQMEPDTYKDICINYIMRDDKKRFAQLMRDKFGWHLGEKHLICNLEYATALARIKYWRDPEPLPQADDIEGLANVWKKIYNSPAGRGTEEEFIRNYERFVSGVENV